MSSIGAAAKQRRMDAPCRIATREGVRDASVHHACGDVQVRLVKGSSEIAILGVG
jgi:hypothetical protein